ncbi:MAG: M2 family metallopeptidase [Planctomycetota bacterium]
MMTKLCWCGILAVCAMGTTLRAQGGAADERKIDPVAAEAEFKRLRDDYVTKFRPLFIESETAWWEANTTGSDAAFGRRKAARNKLVELHSDKAVFARLQALKEIGAIKYPLLARELDVMYRTFLPGQSDPDLQKKIIAIENEVEQTFNTHRSKVGQKELTENDVRTVLSDSKDSKEAEAAWKGYMEVGGKIKDKLAMLAGLRNQMAKQLGFPNFFVMKLTLQELDPDELVRLFDELDTLTKEPFAELKKEIDTAMAARFGVSADQLRPWNFGDLFFQEAPNTGGADFDAVYKDKDLLAITKDYYQSMGTPAEDILARSDLYEKPGKSPHAFSTNLNRADDIRVLCNIKANAYWADTLVHELGHAVYDKYIGKDVPFLLHEPSHSMTTEGFAMMMGAMTKNEDFLVKAVKLSPGEAANLAQAARKSLRAEKLIFSRWAQVMMRFEKGMYENPDQNLGELWWNLKKRYQLLNSPESADRPDYAAKIHIVTVPVYYHNYLMGDLFATQVHAYIARSVLGVDDPAKTSFYGRKEAGDYFKEKIFGPGDLYSWNELTRRATGEPLSPKAFAGQYVRQ